MQELRNTLADDISLFALFALGAHCLVFAGQRSEALFNTTFDAVRGLRAHGEKQAHGLLCGGGQHQFALVHFTTSALRLHCNGQQHIIRRGFPIVPVCGGCQS